MYFPTVFIVFIVLFITFKKNEFGGEFRGLITTIVFAKNLRKGSKNRTWMIWIRWISMDNFNLCTSMQTMVYHNSPG